MTVIIPGCGNQFKQLLLQCSIGICFPLNLTLMVALSFSKLNKTYQLAT